MTRKRYLRGILPALLLLRSVSAASAFANPVSHPVGGFSSGVTIGDIDGDGLADVATSTSGMLLNDGSGLGPEQWTRSRITVSITKRSPIGLGPVGQVSTGMSITLGL